MNLSEISIRRPILAWMMMGALLLFGSLAYLRMGVGNLPDVDLPIVNVSLRLPGAAPEVMELEVVDPIESSLSSIQGVKSVTSSSYFGLARITVEFVLGKNLDSAVNEINTTVAQAYRNLPKDLEPPVITKTNPEGMPILWVMVSSSKMTQPELMSYVRDTVKEKLAKVPGVGDIMLGGYVEPMLRVNVAGKALEKFQLTMTDVMDAVGSEHAEHPAGQIRTAEREQNVRSRGEATTLSEFRALSVMKRGGLPNYRPIPLSSVATVEEGLDDVRVMGRDAGVAAVGLGIRKQSGFNSVAVADAAAARVTALQKELPAGVSARVTVDMTTFVRESIRELNFTLLLSAILTALVCWLFLGSWSATLNVVLAIPTSVLGTFIVLYLMGFTLNTFTLLALSLAIGIVVDDAIMVLENIMRHRQGGEEREAAARIGAREITFAALAATVAIVAVFLPIAFVKGIIGKFLYQFGVTLTVAVLLSLLEALTLTPMRCSQMLDAGHRATRIGRAMDEFLYRLENAYERSLRQALAHRWLTVGIAILMAALSVTLVGKVRKELVPAQDQSLIVLNAEAPPGSSLAFTDAKVREVENFLKHRPEIHSYELFVGDFFGGNPNVASIFAKLKAPSERPLRQNEYMDLYREKLSAIEGLRVIPQDLSQAGFAGGNSRGFPVELSVLGPEWDKLTAYAEQFKARMTASGLMADVDTNYRMGAPEVELVPDRAKARDSGVSVADISRTIGLLSGGALAGKYTKGGHRWDIRVAANHDDVLTPSAMLGFSVRNNRGERVPLASLVTAHERPSVQTISRQDRSRAVAIYANLAHGVSQADALKEVEKIAKEILPAGYHMELNGNAQAMAESFMSLIIALLLGVLVSYMVLASQFNSVKDPFTILLALPFSFSGAIIALYLGNQSLNMYSLIGLVLLMGIVKKNSILLVDFTNQMRDAGLDPNRALLDACPVRLRPILMTSVATIAGALPAAFAWGPGSEVRVPMALAVIGGVLVSTVLTLYVVPAVYSIFAARHALMLPNKKRPHLELVLE